MYVGVVADGVGLAGRVVGVGLGGRVVGVGLGGLVVGVGLDGAVVAVGPDGALVAVGLGGRVVGVGLGSGTVAVAPGGGVVSGEASSVWAMIVACPVALPGSQGNRRGPRKPSRQPISRPITKPSSSATTVMTAQLRLDISSSSRKWWTRSRDLHRCSTGWSRWRAECQSTSVQSRNGQEQPVQEAKHGPDGGCTDHPGHERRRLAAASRMLVRRLVAVRHQQPCAL
jgi:hypothetical protein